jgi:hypothetical protein
LPDGTRSTRLDIGEWYEPARKYLLGESSFPADTYVTMGLCTDEKPQDYWLLPTVSEEIQGLTVVPVYGALFRVWFGRVMPGPIARQLFYPSDDHPIFTTHCWDVLQTSLETLFVP